MLVRPVEWRLRAAGYFMGFPVYVSNAIGDKEIFLLNNLILGAANGT